MLNFMWRKYAENVYEYSRVWWLVVATVGSAVAMARHRWDRVAVIAIMLTIGLRGLATLEAMKKPGR